MADNLTFGIEIKNVQGVQGPDDMGTIGANPDTKESFKDLSSSMQDLVSVIQELIRDNNYQRQRQNNGFLPALGQNLPIPNGQNGVIGFSNAITGTATQIANGNIAGAFQSTINNTTNGLGQAASLASAGGFSDIAGMLLKGFAIGKVVSGVANVLNAVSNSYTETLSGNNDLLGSFGSEGLADNSATTNAIIGRNLRMGMMNSAKGTGLSTDDFISLATSVNKNGLGLNAASNIAKEASRWANFTNGDSGQIAGFAGLIERFGGNGTQSLERLYGAARVSGLEKSQFQEFLSGVQSAMEQGISKGFKLSADDIAENLTYVSLLSGNDELWSGKYGAERYNQISNAMAQNTSLQSTSSMLLYQAASGLNGNDPLNTLKFIESGQWGNTDFLKTLGNNVNSAYAGDKMSQIATYKEMFGLNWTGGEQIYNIIEEAKTKSLDSSEISDRINAIKKDHNLQSDYTRQMDATNELKDSVAIYGRLIAEGKFGATSGIGNILEHMAGALGITKEELESRTLSEEVPDVKYIKGSFNSDINKLLENEITSDRTLALLTSNWTDLNNDGIMQQFEIRMESLTTGLQELAEELKRNTEATEENTDSEFDIVEVSGPTSTRR